MLRFVPPAGAPMPMMDILRGVRRAFSENGMAKEFLNAFGASLQMRYVFGVSSARAGLWIILKSLQLLHPDRFVVAVPAYTCFSVPASVVRAGLKVYPVEMDPETLDFDFSLLERLPDKELLCIVTSNFLGLVNNASRIQQIAQAKGAFVIDDAAQALGATRDGRFSGTLGDVGLYSLARGKAPGTVQGGIILTNSQEIDQAIRVSSISLSVPSAADVVWHFLRLMTTAVFLNPNLYWVPNSLPFLKLGATEFDPHFNTSQLSKLSCSLLPMAMAGVHSMVQIRQRNAQTLAQALKDNPRFTAPQPANDCQPSYIRFPILAIDEATKSRALLRLWEAGIGASSFYPTAICDIPGLGSSMALDDFHMPKAEDLSRRLLTLPTHPLVEQRDLDGMSEILNRLN